MVKGAIRPGKSLLLPPANPAKKQRATSCLPRLFCPAEPTRRPAARIHQFSYDLWQSDNCLLRFLKKIKVMIDDKIKDIIGYENNKSQEDSNINTTLILPETA